MQRGPQRHPARVARHDLGSPRIRRMNAAPTSGRKVTSDRSGQSLIALPSAHSRNRYQVTRAATPISMAKA